MDLIRSSNEESRPVFLFDDFEYFIRILIKSFFWPKNLIFSHQVAKGIPVETELNI